MFVGVTSSVAKTYFIIVMMMSKKLKKYNWFGSHTFVFQTIQLCTCKLDCLLTVKLCVT